MNKVMVIPTYWSRRVADGWVEGDDVYDHPTPLDREGTLGRTLQSVAKLSPRDFELVIVVVAVADDIAGEVDDRVERLVRRFVPEDVPTRVVGPRASRKLRDFLEREGKERFLPFTRLHGYSNIRNAGLWAAHLLGADVVMFVDDDEVFVDADWSVRATEFVGKPLGGRMVYGVAGYYVNPEGTFYLKPSHHPWAEIWGKVRTMNAAFREVIDRPPRLKETPFVFGGAMVIHRELFTRIPFDPQVPRGEDIDYLINARMFHYDFFLDNTLKILHLPPPKTHPVWRQMREDIVRFIVEREKIERQSPRMGMRRVRVEELDPYPGIYLRQDFEDRVREASQMLAVEYLARGDVESAQEALANITLALEKPFLQRDPFEAFLEVRDLWEEWMAFVETHRDALVETLGLHPLR